MIVEIFKKQQSFFFMRSAEIFEGEKIRCLIFASKSSSEVGGKWIEEIRFVDN